MKRRSACMGAAWTKKQTPLTESAHRSMVCRHVDFRRPHVQGHPGTHEFRNQSWTTRHSSSFSSVSACGPPIGSCWVCNRHAQHHLVVKVAFSGANIRFESRRLGGRFAPSHRPAMPPGDAAILLRVVSQCLEERPSQFEVTEAEAQQDLEETIRNVMSRADLTECACKDLLSSGCGLLLFCWVLSVQSQRSGARHGGAQRYFPDLLVECLAGSPEARGCLRTLATRPWRHHRQVQVRHDGR